MEKFLHFWQPYIKYISIANKKGDASRLHLK